MVGPLSATLAVLLDRKWDPESATVWTAPSGDQRAAITDRLHEHHAIIEAVAFTVRTDVWPQAAQHHIGQGLAEGPPSFSAAHEVHASLIRQKEWGRASALKSVTVGGISTDERWSPSDAPLPCPLCGQEDSALHRIISCPALGMIDQSDPRGSIRQSNHLYVNLDDQEWGAYPCLWARGLVPYSKWSVDYYLPPLRP